jgi:uncharacterized membrane protein
MHLNGSFLRDVDMTAFVVFDVAVLVTLVSATRLGLVAAVECFVAFESLSAVP